jgi:hypothetical protein
VGQEALAGFAVGSGAARIQIERLIDRFLFLVLAANLCCAKSLPHQVHFVRRLGDMSDPKERQDVEAEIGDRIAKLPIDELGIDLPVT